MIRRELPNGDQSIAIRRTPKRGFESRRAGICLAILSLVSLGTHAVRSETRVAGTFPELAAVCRPLDPFLVENTIGVGRDPPRSTGEEQRAWCLLPADARIVAYEEHAQFLYACGEVTSVPSGLPAAATGWTKWIRRVIHWKPDVLVIDDTVRRATAGPIRWRVGGRSQPQVDGRQLRWVSGEQELICQTLWPGEGSLQAAGQDGGPDAPVFRYAFEQPPGQGDVRWLHVLHLRKAKVGEVSLRSALVAKDGPLALTISTPQREVRLTLPAPGAAAGWIALQGADGRALVPHRPLASGVLPHGTEGLRLLDRWDSAYRDGKKAPWDTGAPAPELKRVMEAGLVQPCRVVELGCGSGENAIYLAQKGFEVTAIDVAPTAIGLAAVRAERAGVRVRWVLADVLALPELETYDFIFDRGCYHNVRYVDAAGFVASLRRLSHAGTRCLILSLNRDSPPGVREQTMRDDFSALYDFEWLRDSGVEDRHGTARRESWSLMLRRKAEP